MMSEETERSTTGPAESVEKRAPATTEGVHAVLWTREPVCGRRTEAIDRLSDLRAAGVVEDFDVEFWPDEVSLTDRTAHAGVVETYERFREWTAERGLEMAPAFERRTVSPLVGEPREVVRLPMLCLAVYDDGLAGVVPCADGDRRWTVPDVLDAALAEETVELPPG